jgi:hypothetical protein
VTTALTHDAMGNKIFFTEKIVEKYENVKELEDSDLLDALVYYCQRSRISKTAKDKYLETFKESRKRFLSKDKHQEK